MKTKMEYTKLYHYTSPKAWRSIDREGYLKPIRNVVTHFDLGGPLIPQGVDTPAIFGLLEPEPASWRSNPEFPDLWYRLITSRGVDVVLLEVNVLADELYVLDYACVARHIHPHIFMSGCASAAYSYVDEAYKEYWNSKCPFKEYKHNYSLPEAVTFIKRPKRDILLSAMTQ